MTNTPLAPTSLVPDTGTTTGTTTGPKTGLDTHANPESGSDSSAAAVWLETPVLRIVDVAHGRSGVEAIIFRGIGTEPLEIDVVIPPLAPFSVAPSPDARFSSRQEIPGVVNVDSGVAGEVRAELWIRYDATSAMAYDLGQVTFRHRSSGQQWRVELEGVGRLASAFGSL